MASSAKVDLIDLTNAAYAEIERIQNMMSFHDEGSELSFINKNAARQAVTLSPEMKEVLSLALDLSQKTNGTYDITIATELMKRGGLPQLYPTPKKEGSWKDIHLNDNELSFTSDIKLDLGGIAKGYAVDRAFDVLSPIVPYLDQLIINAGGDIRMLQWRNEDVQIRVPDAAQSGSYVDLTMQNACIASSAPMFYDTQSLVIDTKTGEPIGAKQSVSVFASTCMVADALTKITLLLKNPQGILRQYKAEGVQISAQDDTIKVLA